MEIFKKLPEKIYDVVICDPPWKYANSNHTNQAKNHYDCVDTETLGTLDVQSIIHDKSVVFMWTTSPMLKESLNLMAYWGLHYRGVSFVWVKTSKFGNPIGAQGVRPTVVKPTTEFVIVGSPQQFGRPLRINDESVVQTIFAQRENNIHSRKPSEVFARIEMLYPNYSKIELFARQKRENWDCWGNEVE